MLLILVVTLQCSLLTVTVTVIVGNVIDIRTGEWVGRMSGVGAGLDSFYEYLLKVTNN